MEGRKKRGEGEDALLAVAVGGRGGGRKKERKELESECVSEKEGERREE